jgi:hypothetical protein
LVDRFHDASEFLVEDLYSFLGNDRASVLIAEKEFGNVAWLPVLIGVHFLHADHSFPYFLLLCEVIFSLHYDAILSKCGVFFVEKMLHFEIFKFI